MNYIVADIHGEITKLERIVNYIIGHDSSAKFIFIGDYIDKGENAKETLDFLTAFKKDRDCVFLWGNHEYCWMDIPQYKSYLLKYGGLNTIRSFNGGSVEEVSEKLKNNYSNIFDSLVNYQIVGEYIVTHSGVSPKYYPAKELQEANTIEFLFNRYDFMKENSLVSGQYKVVFGHTSFYKPYSDEYKIGVDTGACYLEGQPLTAFCVEEELFLNSNRESYLLKKMDNNNCPNIIRSKPWRL
jgi:serine/threonine protein phosphatase 1